MVVRVQSDPFDPAIEISGFGLEHADTGAIVTFSGVVRNDDDLGHMVIEHYPEMTERALAKIESEAAERWALTDSLIVHRYGTMRPGDVIMMVATAAKHRTAAFEAAEFLMDFLKSRAPFWKKEFRNESETWVESNISDEAALDRWRTK